MYVISEEHAAVLTKPGSRVTIPVVASTFVTSIPAEPSVAGFTGRSSSRPSPKLSATFPLPDGASGIRVPFTLYTGAHVLSGRDRRSRRCPVLGAHLLYPYATPPYARLKRWGNGTTITVAFRGGRTPRTPVTLRTTWDEGDAGAG